jgi:hypothetical protein
MQIIYLTMRGRIICLTTMSNHIYQSEREQSERESDREEGEV